jgi:subtilase family serine protease
MNPMNVSLNSLRAGAARLAGCAAILSLFGLSAAAQKPEARILAPVDNTARVTLAGTRPSARLQNATDAGRMSAMTPLQGVSIAFSRSAAQETALEALIAAQQDPASPQYHQWLSPDQFAAEFGAADADLAKVQGWLQGQGFTIDEVARNRSIIRFSGNIAQIEAAFGTEMHYYDVGGQGQATERHFAPASDLTVPAAFSGAVLTVANLSDFRPRSHMKQATAKFTSGQSGSHFVSPKDVATIYDINAAYNSGWTGAGQSIAVIGQSAVVTGDISNFQTAAGVPVRSPNMIVMPLTGASTISPGDESESDLDLEYTSAIARGATIDFVYTGCTTPATLNCNYGAFDAFSYAVMNKTAPIISISYGECEPALSFGSVSTTFPPYYSPGTASNYYVYYNSFAQQAAAQGQSIVSAAGDQGSTDCYGIAFSGFTTAQEAGLAVDWPASSQYVTGLGGTEYLAADVASTNSTYWLSPGIDTGIDAIGSALSYIPEQAWNDDAANSGLSSGGGGISVLTPHPSWQTGTIGGVAIPANSFRTVPDIALASSPNNAGYLYCSSDTSTGITLSCSNGFRDATASNLTIAGGTSFAAPIFAGMLAIIAQSKGVTTGMGLVNPTLYTLAASSAYGTAFHDITSGNNACTNGTAYAVAFTSAGAVSQFGPACASTGLYATGTGYDMATGLGSVDLNNLLTAWPGTTAAAPAKFTLSAAAATITDGSTGTATITITPVGGYKGTVSLSLTGNPLINYACFTTASGTVTGTSAATATVTIYTTTSSAASASSVCPTGAQALLQTGGKVASVEAPPQPGHHVPGELPAGIAAAGLLAIGFAGRRSRRLRGAIAVAVLAIAGFGLAGCGSGGSGTGVGGGGTTTPPPTGGTAPKGTYTITVTGEDTVTGLQASTTFSLTLQ